ncbi:outer membrane beta-barrel protein [Olivibacter sp. CPCC 100613]|uniref:outer membrane beta-barrel protein n=1 Tax=Olivibacter sp. CPCC 100613 TaxID=3079931 RepID=UPI002FF4F475
MLFNKGLAQFSVSGMVIDSLANKELSGVTVKLAKEDGKYQDLITSSDHNGRFELTDVPTGKYNLTFILLGYRPLILSKQIVQNTDLKTVSLHSDQVHLEEVAVNENRLFQQNGDEIEYNISIDSSLVNKNVKDVLASLPFFKLTFNGNEQKLEYKNGKRYLIMLNGQKFGAITRYPNQTLSNFPSDFVKKVKIIENPSAKIVNEGYDVIIDIISSSSYYRGYIGKVAASYNTLTNHTADAFLLAQYNKWNIQTLVRNDREKNWGMQNGTIMQNDHNTVVQNFSVIDTGLSKKQIYDVSADYRFNEDTYIAFYYSFGRVPFDRQVISQYDDIPVPQYISTGYLNRKNEVGLDYSMKFSEISTIALTAKYEVDNDGLDNSVLGDIYRYGKNQISNKESAVDLNHLLSFKEGKFSIENGVKFVSRKFFNQFGYDTVQNKVIPFGFSDRIDQRLWLSYNKFTYKHDKLSASVQIDIDRLIVDDSSRSSFTNILPSGFVQYNIKPNIYLQGTYTASMIRPAYMTLNRFNIYQDSRTVTTGLRVFNQQKNQAYSLSLNHFGNKLDFSQFLNVSATKVSDLIIKQTSLTSSNGENVTMYANIENNTIWSAQYGASFKPLKILRLSPSVYVIRNTFVWNENGLSREKSSNVYNLSLFGQLEINPAKMSLDFNVEFAPDYLLLQGYQEGRDSYSIQINKNLLSRKLNLFATATNFLKKDLVLKSVIEDRLLSRTLFASSPYRSFSFGLSFNFGKLRTMEARSKRIKSTDLFKEPK